MDLQIRTGLVGFFDILGYREIIANNLIPQAAEILSGSLIGMPEKVRAEFVGRFKFLLDGKDLLPDFSRKTTTLMISDTIILAMKSDFSSEFGLGPIGPAVFLLMVSYLLRRSFDSGFPLRGAIDYGDFYIENQTFAGVPFVNSFELTHRLDFSGCVLTKDVETKIREYGGHLQDFFSYLVFPYVAHLKDGEEAEHLVVDWFSSFSGWAEKQADIRQYIVSKFSAFNKKVRRNVFPKIDNTEMVLRYRMATIVKNGYK